MTFENLLMCIFRTFHYHFLLSPVPFNGMDIEQARLSYTYAP